MNDFELNDERLDRRLREVPSPSDDLIPRLREIAAWSDSELELALRDVPVSSRLREKLHAVPCDSLVDASLAVARPSDNFLMRLHEMIDREAAELRERKQRRRFFEGLLSLSLGLLLLLGYGSFAWNSLLFARPSSEPVRLVELLAPQPPNLLASAQPIAPANESPIAEEFAIQTSEIGLPPFEQVEPNGVLIADAAPSPEATSLDFANLVRSGKYAASLLSRIEQLTPVRVRIRNAERTSAPHGSRGISESSSDYDRTLLVREGVHIPITPTSKQWRTSRPPLADETSGFDRSLASVVRGIRPAADEVRTEDFIASLRYDYESPPPGSLNLIAQAGPSPFGDSGTAMLHIGVKAPSPASEVPPSVLAIVIDRAASADWETVCVGVAEFLSRLRDEDRASFVVYGESMLLSTEPLTRDDAPRLRQALAQIKSSDILGDAVPAWESALESVTRSEYSASTRRAIIHLGTLAPIAAPDASLRLRYEFESARISLATIDLTDETPSLSPLASIAKTLGDRSPITTGTRRTLMKSLLFEAFGSAALTAREAKLEVAFDPTTVASYRLLGHEGDAFGRIAAVSSDVDLLCGDEATVLYEVRLKTTETKSPPASITLKWRDPLKNAERSLRRPVARGEFFTAWDRLSDAFRRAAAAAEAAEWLRESRLRLRETNGSRVSDAASLRQSLEAFPPADRRTADDESLLNLVRLAEKAKSRSRADRK